MTLKVPYTDNLTTNAKLPGQIAVDMKAIEHEDQQDDQALVEEIQDRRDADKELDSKINQSEDRLNKQIAALEQIIFGQSPQEANMADNSTPPLANGGVMLINLTSKEDK